MQNFLFPLIIFIISLALTTCQKKTLKVITVTQIIEHPSLDQERSSFIETLSNLGFGDTIKIIFENAHGNMTTAAQIAQKFSGLKPDVMVAFSTPSAQSLAKISQEKGIPLIFSSVTDPQQAHLAQSPWITGISDGLSPTSQIKFIQTLFPFSKKIGIIYNPSEVNSVVFINEFEKVCLEKGLILYKATAKNTNDVPQAVKKLLEKVDIFYIPNDNTAVSAMASIIQQTLPYKIPVLAGDTGSVEKGALACLGYDRTLLGQKAGELVGKVLLGRKVSELPIEADHPLTLYINEKTLQTLGLNLTNLPSNVVWIKEDR